MTTVGRWYEIRLVGRLGPALRLAFPGLEPTVEPRHYVLVVPASGVDLSAVLARPGLRHVEVVRAQLRATPPLNEVMPPATTREWAPAAVGASSPGGVPSCCGVPVTDHQWEIHVSGVLPKSALDAELAGLVMAVQPATTVLSGPLRDEAELRGVLDRHAVTRVAPGRGASAARVGGSRV